MMDHGLASRATETGSQHGNGGSCKRNGLWRSAPSGYDQKMTSQNVHDNAKRLVKALIDRANLDAPDGRINQVEAQTGL